MANKNVIKRNKRLLVEKKLASIIIHFYSFLFLPFNFLLFRYLKIHMSYFDQLNVSSFTYCPTLFHSSPTTNHSKRARMLFIVTASQSYEFMKFRNFQLVKQTSPTKSSLLVVWLNNSKTSKLVRDYFEFSYAVTTLCDACVISVFKQFLSLKEKEAVCIDEEKFNNAIIKMSAAASGLLPFAVEPRYFWIRQIKLFLNAFIPRDDGSKKDKPRVPLKVPPGEKRSERSSL